MNYRILILIISLCCLVASCDKNKQVQDSFDNSKVYQWADYSDAEEFPFNEDFELKIKLDVFPDTEFIWTDRISAYTDGKESVLVEGTPVLNAFFTDLNNDGFPELCSSVMFGYGMCDEHIIVCDYRNGQNYCLWDRGEYDYTLFSENDELYVKKSPYGWWLEESSEPYETGRLAIENSLLIFEEQTTE
ncbi:MAG: hypothetical protein K2J40_01975 [Ruminococcus sp.]|nr:hypothetical protein [Ruminococcus sp.]